VFVAVADDRLYDCTTVSVFSGASLGGLLGSDLVSLSNEGIGTFADKNVGTDKSVTTSIALDGVDAANYTLVQPDGLTADITPRTLNVVFVSIDKAYDATIAAPVSFTDDRIAGDVLDITATASFTDPNVGADKLISLSDTSLGGTDGSNYTLTIDGAALTGDIMPASLTIAANGVTQEVSGVAFTGGDGITFSGFVGDEDQSVLDGALVYGGSSQGAVNEGTYTIIPSGFTAQNYSIDYQNGLLSLFVPVTPPPVDGGNSDGGSDGGDVGNGGSGSDGGNGSDGDNSDNGNSGNGNGSGSDSGSGNSIDNPETGNAINSFAGIINIQSGQGNQGAITGNGNNEDEGTSENNCGPSPSGLSSASGCAQ